jgi:hypothetical protein
MAGKTMTVDHKGFEEHVIYLVTKNFGNKIKSIDFGGIFDIVFEDTKDFIYALDVKSSSAKDGVSFSDIQYYLGKKLHYERVVSSNVDTMIVVTSHENSKNVTSAFEEKGIGLVSYNALVDVLFSEIERRAESINFSSEFKRAIYISSPAQTRTYLRKVVVPALQSAGFRVLMNTTSISPSISDFNKIKKLNEVAIFDVTVISHSVSLEAGMALMSGIETIFISQNINQEYGEMVNHPVFYYTPTINGADLLTKRIMEHLSSSN